MWLGDFNVHIDRYIDGFDGGNAVGQRNFEEGMLLEFCVLRELSVSNIWFR